MSKKRKIKLSDSSEPKDMKIRYYVKSDKFGIPKVTVCLVLLDNILCRGVAICCGLETETCGFIELTGKGLAKHRAYKAWNKHISMDSVSRAEAIEVLDLVGARHLNLKCYFNTMLTDYEKDLFPELIIKQVADDNRVGITGITGIDAIETLETFCEINDFRFY